MKCRNELDSKRMVGNGNHQYGLKGKKNGSWKSDKRKTSNGYIKIRKPYHPFKDCDGFVLEHRLIAEKYLLNKDNSIMLDGKYYLKKPLVVHHKDENKQNNAPENLMILTRGKHRSLHAQMNKNKKQLVSKNSANCWELLRVLSTKAKLETTSVNVKNDRNWTISIQAPEKT